MRRAVWSESSSFTYRVRVGLRCKGRGKIPGSLHGFVHGHVLLLVVILAVFVRIIASDRFELWREIIVREEDILFRNVVQRIERADILGSTSASAGSGECVCTASCGTCGGGGDGCPQSLETWVLVCSHHKKTGICFEHLLTYIPFAFETCLVSSSSGASTD